MIFIRILGIFADRISIAVSIGLRELFGAFIMNFWKTYVLLPMVRPVMVLHGHLLRRLHVLAHGDAVNQTNIERDEPEDEENYS